MKSIFKTNYLVLIILAFTFYQCEDHQARFDDPPWLGGTNIETLEGKGNYNHFLALMDKAEYRRSIENQMFTLFVPNDSCFEAYFNSVGITSVEDLTIEQAEELFCQHNGRRKLIIHNLQLIITKKQKTGYKNTFTNTVQPIPCKNY